MSTINYLYLRAMKRKKKQKLTKVSDYAKRKEITTQAVYKQIDAGKLETVKQYGLTLIVE